MIAHLKLLKRALDIKWVALHYNNFTFQKIFWRGELSRYDWDKKEIYGNEWGDPDNANHRFGNYVAVKNRLISLARPESTILEIGSYSGKWVQYLLSAREIICADIDDLGFLYIRQKFPQEHIRFYLTKGNELKGIKDDSVDLVFSMDTFVRVSKKHILDYLKESYRVLKNQGRIFFHLPCVEKVMCHDRAFTDLSLKEINKMVHSLPFKDISIDHNTLNHGVIVEAVK